MTAMRINSKVKCISIFSIVFLVLLFSLKIFNNSKDQFDQFRIICEQEKVDTSEKVKVLVEQKLRLENSLAAERKLNQQTKDELQKKLDHERKIHEESISETNLRFSSLQQHFKLTKSQLDDVTSECAKTKKQQNEEVNSQSQNIKLLHGQLAQVKRESEKDIELWKAKVNQLEADKSRLEQLLSDNKNGGDVGSDLKLAQLKNIKLEKELGKYKENCPYRPIDGDEQQQMHQLQPPLAKPAVVKASMASVKNFDQQVLVSEDLYKIQIRTNRTDSNTNKHEIEPTEAVVNIPSSGGGLKKPMPIMGVLNSVENFQIIPKPIAETNNNVLQQPVLVKTSTASSDVAKGKKTSESEVNKVVPALAIAPTQSSSSSTKKKVQSNNKIKLKLPQGVPPAPLQSVNDIDEQLDINNYAKNNQQPKHERAGPNKSNQNPVLFDNDTDEHENGAHEDVHEDNNLVDIDKNNQINSHHHFKDVHNANNNNNNAAEEDLNLYNGNDVAPKPQMRFVDQKSRNGGLNNGNSFLTNNKNEKLLKEIEGDHGKEYPDELEDDLPMDGQAEDQGDVGEYDDPKAQGIAERN